MVLHFFGECIAPRETGGRKGAMIGVMRSVTPRAFVFVMLLSANAARGDSFPAGVSYPLPSAPNQPAALVTALRARLERSARPGRGDGQPSVLDGPHAVGRHPLRRDAEAAPVSD